VQRKEWRLGECRCSSAVALPSSVGGGELLHASTDLIPGKERTVLNWTKVGCFRAMRCNSFRIQPACCTYRHIHIHVTWIFWTKRATVKSFSIRILLQWVVYLFIWLKIKDNMFSGTAIYRENRRMLHASAKHEIWRRMKRKKWVSWTKIW
jgi:hypothetical protein